ncbi:MAG: T9SS type A sorting domain-containing protein [Bacteroidales bacterium]|nr:T9SS type A sorting domain-containing protein [Bacteroidales bacterium]MCF8455794.1 T9SS type A sorting domain-containing protein [Bacteroidales bacterium]
MSNFAYVNGTYWFGNNFRIFKQEGSDLIEYNYTNSGLPIGDFVKDIESDANGNLWVATSFGLTKMMDDTIWTTYHFSFPTVTIFHQIIYDQNNIMWIKAGSGIIKYDGNDWLYYNKENSNIMGGVTAMMFSPQNELWVGTATGLSKFEAYSHDTLTVTQTIGVYNSVDKIKGFNYAVYPNPFQDEFIIDGANIQDNIVVYDILGKKQGFEIVSNHPFTVRLNDNKKGIFLVKIESNSQVCTFKILKE